MNDAMGKLLVAEVIPAGIRLTLAIAECHDGSHLTENSEAAVIERNEAGIFADLPFPLRTIEMADRELIQAVDYHAIVAEWNDPA